MTGRARRGAGERGMTVIELMIAIVILGVVVAAAFSVAFSIMNSYREHRRSMAVERSTRGAMSVLIDAVRNASPGVRNGDIIDLVGCQTWKGIRVQNQSAGPDSISLIYATGAVGQDELGTPVVASSLQAAFDTSSTQLVLAHGSLLRPGDDILVTDFIQGHLVEVQSVVQAGPVWNVTLTQAPQDACDDVVPFTYPVLTTVIHAQLARFSIETLPNGHPVLMMDPDADPTTDNDEAVAEGVEDVQIAIGVDRSGNPDALDESGGAANDDDWVYNNSGDTDLPDIGTKPYRAIRLTVIGRSLDETGTLPISLRPAAEDRPAAAQPDEFRRRSLSTTVEIRNLEGSPQ